MELEEEWKKHCSVFSSREIDRIVAAHLDEL
jgi:hypothetical protein